MQPGETVFVTNYDGKLLKRKIVEVIGEIVSICTEDEFQLAKQNRSLPWCAGFKKEYIRSA